MHYLIHKPQSSTCGYNLNEKGNELTPPSVVFTGLIAKQRVSIVVRICGRGMDRINKSNLKARTHL